MIEAQLTYFTCTLGEARKFASNTPDTISDFLEAQAKDQSDTWAAGVSVPTNANWGYQVYTFKQLHHGTISVAKRLRPCLSEAKTSRCVALLCPSSLDFLFTWLGLMRLGFSVLLIAPQCPPNVIVSLCKSCNATQLFYDESFQNLADASNSACSEITVHLLPWQAENETIANLVSSTQLHGQLDMPHKPTRKDVAYIHHSSGTSTGIPKPIPQTHQAGFGVLPRLDGRAAATFTTTPLYHGGIADCLRAWTSSALIWLFPGGSRPITAKNILSCTSSISTAQRDIGTPSLKYFSSVPYVLEMLAENDDGISMLQEMAIVGVGGAALPAKVGSALCDRGVNLCSRFGSAECGFLLSSHRDYANDQGWAYLRLPSANQDLNFERQGGSNALAELVVSHGWPHMAIINRPNGAYATSDLFMPHPHINNAWKYHSRNDSQITLLTGKKFDPAPIEDAITAESSSIQDTFVIGSEKQYPGALIFVSSATEIAKDDVWQVISQINQTLEPHCRISKQMFALIDEGKPQKSDKGTKLRGATLTEFSQQIEDLYLRSTESESSSGPALPDSDFPSTIRKIVNDVLGHFLQPSDDFYEHGVDSTMATQIKSRLQAEIMGNMELPRNVVYDSGNIEELSRFLIRLRSGQEDPEVSAFDEMEQLVKDYSDFDLAIETVSEERSSNNVVCLTGASGSLGANILAVLLGNPSIIKIICLVRAPTEEEARSKVTASLSRRGKPPIADFSGVQCEPFDPSQIDLGISRDTLVAIRRTATHFIHAAWAVNFSLPLRSFVRDNIAGLQRLLRLAMSCDNKAIFAFCSSTSSTIRAMSPISETISISPADADELGYSRSKWVAEAICTNASRVKGFGEQVKILRIGQLTGDTSRGIWNMSEAWPLMLSTFRDLKCLPELQQKLDWLPMNIAAQAVVDITFTNASEEDIGGVYHVLNNAQAPMWEDLLVCGHEFASTTFENVDAATWLRKLEDLPHHPAKRLIWLWQKALMHSRNEREGPSFRTERARSTSQTLGGFTGLDKDLLRKIWIWLEGEIEPTHTES